MLPENEGKMKARFRMPNIIKLNTGSGRWRK